MRSRFITGSQSTLMGYRQPTLRQGQGRTTLAKRPRNRVQPIPTAT
ncbi:MAG: hypothetical protein F6K65_05225 [Moorea sp. SIO3C2]|nr:hypothetical protein [Moorena sp. SIO3C2]